MWAVSFNACLRHRRIFDITGMLLRHHYGTATGVSSDNSSLMFNKDYPAYPPNNPETAISTTQSLTVKADATNGTLYYDVDGKTTATLRDFSSLASTIGGKFIRVAARYQVDGSLVAVRLWASSFVQQRVDQPRRPRTACEHGNEHGRGRKRVGRRRSS